MPQRAQAGHVLQNRPARSSLMGVAGNHAGEEDFQALVSSTICPSDRHGFIGPVLFWLSRGRKHITGLEPRVRSRERVHQLQWLSDVASVGFAHHYLGEHRLAVGGH